MGGGNSKASFNTRDKARLQSESDQIGKDASGITQRLLLDAPQSHILAECLSETSGVRRHVAAREAFQRQAFHACRLAPDPVDSRVRHAAGDAAEEGYTECDG